jgi:FlaA1/EpsC-like NDP-sugar epimerase
MSLKYSKCSSEAVKGAPPAVSAYISIIMLNINKFISENITSRQISMFATDIEANKTQLRKEIEGRSLLVIGGAGSIGSSYIHAMLPFKPSKLVVVDLSENGLAELTRDLRSTYGMYVPDEYRTYTLDFSNPLFERIFRNVKNC